MQEEVSKWFHILYGRPQKELNFAENCRIRFLGGDRLVALLLYVGILCVNSQTIVFKISQGDAVAPMAPLSMTLHEHVRCIYAGVRIFNYADLMFEI